MSTPSGSAVTTYPKRKSFYHDNPALGVAAIAPANGSDEHGGVGHDASGQLSGMVRLDTPSVSPEGDL